MRLDVEPDTSPARVGGRGRDADDVGWEVIDESQYPRWHHVEIVHESTRMKKGPVPAGAPKPKPYLFLVCKIVGDTAEGFKIFHVLNLQNANPGVKDRAWKELRRLVGAAGLKKGQDSAWLVDKVVDAWCEVAEDAKFGKQLKIRGWRQQENDPLPPRTEAPPPGPPRRAEPTGSHRYSRDDTAQSATRYTPGEWVGETNADGVHLEYEPEPGDSRTEWRPPPDSTIRGQAQEPVREEPIGDDDDSDVPF